MNKEEAKKYYHRINPVFNQDLKEQVIDWLYANDLEIIEKNPKSKFMEEYFAEVHKISASHWNEWLAKLIDKHKMDK